MESDEICCKIQNTLEKTSNKQLLKICKIIIPEESIGEIEDDDFKDEVISILLESICLESSLIKKTCKLLYYQEDIYIDEISEEDEKYFNEEYE